MTDSKFCSIVVVDAYNTRAIVKNCVIESNKLSSRLKRIYSLVIMAESIEILVFITSFSSIRDNSFMFCRLGISFCVHGRDALLDRGSLRRHDLRGHHPLHQKARQSLGRNQQEERQEGCRR